MTTSMSWATSVPSRITPVRWRTIAGWRLVVAGDVLVAVVDHPHRLARPLRQQRGMEGDDRRVLLLAAEAAAGLGLDDRGLGVVSASARFSALWT